MFSIVKLHRDSHFSYQPGDFGVESTFDIVFEDTGDVIASLFYWDAKEETEADTRALVAALDRLYDRGGHLWIDGLEKLARVMETRYYGEKDDPAADNDAGISDSDASAIQPETPVSGSPTREA